MFRFEVGEKVKTFYDSLILEGEVVMRTYQESTKKISVMYTVSININGMPHGILVEEETLKQYNLLY